MIHKSNKPANETSSYHPISLTPVLSNLERVLLAKLELSIKKTNLIKHQFELRIHHSTVNTCITFTNQTIRQCLGSGEYCSVVFLGDQQAFDKVWHEGPMCKIKNHLHYSLFLLLSFTYLTELFS